MIGIMVIAVVVGYILLAKFIIKRVYQKYKTKKAKNIALAIMILIPTWDVVLGFPIYAYLCVFESGTKIYKTVDNVEGFYIGDWNSRGYSKVPPKPYRGYQFVDYQEVHHSKPTGKYFRTTWKDANATNDCIQGIGFPNDYNAKLAQNGKCIVKEEIAVGEVSGLWEVSKKVIKNYYILYLKIKYTEVEAIDPRTNEKYFTIEGYLIDKSWITGVLNISSGRKGKLGCNNYINWDNSISSTSVIYTINKTLKGEK